VLEVVNVVEDAYVTIIEEATPTPEAIPANAAAAPAPAPTPAPAAAQVPVPGTAPVVAPAAKAAVFNPAAEAGSDAGAGLSVVLTPYTGPRGAVECKSQETINGEFNERIEKGFVRFRFHGSLDCDESFKANTAARATNTTVFLGAFNLRDIDNEARKLVTQVTDSGGWDNVHMVSLGNEDISKGMTAAEVIKAIQIGTDILRAGGYEGPIVHAETVDNVLNNAEIMCGPEAGTKIAVNIFPFFNPNVAPEDAGAEVMRQIQQVSECSQKHSQRTVGNDVVVSEVGYASCADGPNGRAVASADAQISAISAIVSTVSVEHYLFTAYDEQWKPNPPGTRGAENCYGIFRKGYSLDWPALRAARSRFIHPGRA
jgi:glucan 1,3-beta-glucosidase